MANPAAALAGLPGAALDLMNQQAILQNALSNTSAPEVVQSIERLLHRNQAQLDTTMAAMDFMNTFETQEGLNNWASRHAAGYFNLNDDFVTAMLQGGFGWGGNWGPYGVFDGMHFEF